MDGAWIVYDFNVGAYPIAIFDNELDAYRFREELGYGYVKFWAFGTKWTDAK
jgi:hypothetical protein